MSDDGVDSSFFTFRCWSSDSHCFLASSSSSNDHHHHHHCRTAKKMGIVNHFILIIIKKREIVRDEYIFPCTTQRQRQLKQWSNSTTTTTSTHKNKIKNLTPINIFPSLIWIHMNGTDDLYTQRSVQSDRFCVQSVE